MCGRIALFTPPERLARLLDAQLAAGVDPEGRPSWNVGPQQTLFAVSDRDGRTLDRYQWGLVPTWAKDPSIGNRMFNARGETVAEKPSFRSAFAKRPCVIPVDGFYEWRRLGSTKEPHYFTRSDQGILLLAGLYEPARRDPADARPTCTVITTTPNADLAPIHDRMPVVLEADEVDGWLDTDPTNLEVRKAMLDPAPDGTLADVVVGSAVGNVRNNGPSLIEPVG